MEQKNNKRILSFEKLTTKNLTQALIDVLTYFLDYKQKIAIAGVELERLKQDLATINNNLLQPLNLSKMKCESLIKDLDRALKENYDIYTSLIFSQNNNIVIESPLWKKDKSKIKQLFDKYNVKFVSIEQDLQKVINVHNKNNAPLLATSNLLT